MRRFLRITSLSLAATLIGVLLFGFGCDNGEKNLSPRAESSKEVDFCVLMADPEAYKSKLIQTKAIIRGYHDFILYDENCCELEKVVKAQGIGFEERRRLFEKIKEVYPNWNKSDVKGEITVLGRLEVNDIKPVYSSEKMCRNKFTLSEVINHKPDETLTNSCFFKIADSVIIEKK